MLLIPLVFSVLSLNPFHIYSLTVNVWKLVAEVLDVNIGSDYESIAKLWVANKKHLVTNVFSSAVLWTLWKLRNEICFQGVV
jgi:hypothetical protein